MHSACAGPAWWPLCGHRRVLPFSHGHQHGRFYIWGQQSVEDGVRTVKVIYKMHRNFSIYLHAPVLYNFCRGVLKIAEVASRFDNVRKFVTALANLGFKMVSKVRHEKKIHFYTVYSELRNRVFYSWRSVVLKGCLQQLWVFFTPCIAWLRCCGRKPQVETICSKQSDIFLTCI